MKGKTQATTQEKINDDTEHRPTTAPSIVIRDRDRRRDRDLAFFARSRSTDLPLESRNLPRRIFLSNLAIFLDGSSSRISRPTYDMLRSRIFLSRRRSRSRSGAISRRRDRDQWRDLAIATSRPTARSRRFSSLARARSLSHFPEML